MSDDRAAVLEAEGGEDAVEALKHVDSTAMFWILCSSLYSVLCFP